MDLVGIFTIFLLIDYSSASGNERQKVHNKEEGVKVEEQKENLNKSEEKNESIEKEFVNKKVGSEVAKHFQSLLQIKKEDGNLLLDFTLNNISKEDLTLTFTSGQLYDFLVFNSNNLISMVRGSFFYDGNERCYVGTRRSIKVEYLGF